MGKRVIVLLEEDGMLTHSGIIDAEVSLKGFTDCVGAFEESLFDIAPDGAEGDGWDSRKTELLDWLLTPEEAEELLPDYIRRGWVSKSDMLKMVAEVETKSAELHLKAQRMAEILKSLE